MLPTDAAKVKAPTLLQAFARQQGWCSTLSPFSARVLQRSRLWLQADAQALAVFEALADDPLQAAVALRWLGGLHHLALRGLQPWAGLWPPASGAAQASDKALYAAVRAAWHAQPALVQAALAGPPQTNEVQRSAALLPGLLHVAARTGLPLVLLEIGASAGLNLWCDRYRHEHADAQGHAGWAWGDATAPLTLRSEWRGPVPAEAGTNLRINRRAGCDAKPINLRDADAALRLASFIWPDQPERLARLRAAAGAAAVWMAQDSVAVQASPAAAFVAAELQTLQPGQTTVLMHSVVWQYIAPAEQAAVLASVQAAAQAATASAPLAWLRLEPTLLDQPVQLRCQLWPGGEDRLLARAHPHGAWVEWLAV